MKRLAIVLALTGCVRGGAAPREPLAHAAPAEERAERELARLKAIAAVDPVGLLTSLGVESDKFDHIARALYLHWNLAHPAETPPAPPAAVEVDRPSQPNARWWCTSSTFEASGGGCFRNASSCETLRASMASSGITYDKCEPVERAACFEIQNKLSGKRFPSCAPDFSSCKLHRSSLDPEDYKALSECAATN